MLGQRSATRRTACRACAQAKRACDRKEPRCGRCEERLIECVFAPRTSYRTPGAFIIEPAPVPVAIGSVAAIDTTPLESPAAFPLPPQLFSSKSDASQIGIGSQGGNPLNPITASPNTDPSLTWFLTPETWELENNPPPTPPSPLKHFKTYTKKVQGWLRDWATHGHNAFIHKELYRTGLPSCLQDAYTTLVTYLAKNEETEDMILQIVEDRATNLLQQSVLLEGVEVLDARAHLARTQALLVYTIIRLYDGCPRQRAQAEALNIPTLDQWMARMWKAAESEAQLLCSAWEGLSLSLTLVGTTTTTTTNGDLELAVWRAWILTESIRRTWLVATSTMKIYQTLKNGWVECSGGVGLTTRRGLWDSASAPRWMQQVRKEGGPLFVLSNRMMDLLKEPYAEIDDIVQQLFGIALAPEQIEHWIARSEVEG